jgi:NhaA family Na+:H+ antiporter
MRDFLASEAGGGMLLILAAALALIFANISERSLHIYEAVLHFSIGPTLSPKLGPMTVHLWINDGLMAIFFLLVGLEIKREFVSGRLSTWERRRLPVIAAMGGMVAPALVYIWIIGGHPNLMRGWAIPAATDIAFAIGVLALLGSRIPPSLKLFLVTVAIVDDMGAVAIIALAYTSDLYVPALGLAVLVMGIMHMLGRRGVTALPIYLLCFAVLWYAILLSGVHATIAGVLAAFMIPIGGEADAPEQGESPLVRLEHGLHPWSAYLIVPLFGFANAGLWVRGMGVEHLIAPLPLGVAAALFFGKQVGIFGAIWLCVKLGIAVRPRGATWPQIYGVALLCGIGFTMSLFIGGLAFPQSPDMAGDAKIGILAGSLISALLGFAVLRLARPSADAG